MRPDLRLALQHQLLTGDGAMGTYLYQLGFPVGISYEELNLLQPQVIADIHRRYYEAGAKIIETNTFSANKEKLSKFGLEQEVKRINRAGADLARQTVGDDAYVLGAVGSIRGSKRKNVLEADVRIAFHEQVEALLEASVDGLLLETFYDLDELLIALRLIRNLSDLPVICQFTTEGNHTTHDGIPLQEAFERLKDEGADVVGFNCVSGPNGIMQSIGRIHPLEQVPFSVYPNAGIPDYVDGRIVFGATPEYFAETALRFADLGARIIGGCCGTTPEHIAAISKALRGYVPSAEQAFRLRGTETGRDEEHPVISTGTAETGDSSYMDGVPNLVDLVKQRPTVIVELDPPRTLDINKFMVGAKALKDACVDAITMADNSLAVTRMSNLALGALVQQRLNVRPLVHIACRDRNSIGTQSHLMGMDALGIDHVLAVTGDPARFGDLPGSSSVYDLTSFEIIRMIKQLNKGLAFSGKPLKKKARLVIGAAFNPNVKYLEKAVQRLEKKIAAGADYIMTQPVYDHALIERIHESTKHMDVPIFLGIMPLASGRNAEYLHNEVPGIQLPDETRGRMAGLEGEAGRAAGTEMAKELIDTALQYFNGIYLMTPFLFYDMSVALTEYIWGKTSSRHPLLSRV
ncbi:bifunctional homocysteine S-methyltransferase/methylenetetrahydrofolate reductase [Paenibacillus larvae]